MEKSQEPPVLDGFVSMVSSGFSLKHIQRLPFETARRWSPTSNFQTFLRAMKVKTSKPPGSWADINVGKTMSVIFTTHDWEW